MESAGRLALRAAGTAADRAMTRMHRLEENIHNHQERVHEVQETFIGIIPWIKRIVYFWFASSILLSLSVVQYGLFYIVTMPTHHAAEQLYFDYSVCEIDETCSPSKMRNVDSCSPVATMDLFMRHAQWEGFHDDVLPQPLASERVLKQRQPYFIEIALDLPESNANLQAGMFGVAVELLSSNGTSLASSIRSARLPHESPWVGVVRKIFWLPGFLVGAFMESRTLLIPSFRNYIESSENPLRFITIRIMARKNGLRRETPVEIVGGEVRVGEELNRFQGIMKLRFYTCYVIGTLTLFIVNSVLLFIGVMLLEERRRLRQEETAQVLEVIFEGGDHDHDDGPLGGAFDSQRERGWGGEGDDWFDLPTNQEQAAQESDLHVIPEANDQGLGDSATYDANVSHATQFMAERESTAGSDPERTQPEVSEREDEDDVTDRVMRGHTDPFIVFTDHDDLNF